jgi:hypothetical protein
MMLIENDIVFISIPKCASISVHLAFEKADLKIEPTFKDDANDLFGNGYVMPSIHGKEVTYTKIKTHRHQSISEVYTFLGSKVNTITIKRDYCKRFLSGVYYIFGHWVKEAYGLSYIPNKITNDFIYEYFTDEIIDCIKSMIQNDKNFEFDKKMKSKIIVPLIEKYSMNYNKKYIIENMMKDNIYINWRVFDSQEAWKSGYKPTYEFDIYELYKFEELIKSKYDTDIKIGKDNQINYAYPQMDIKEDQKLRDWIWNKFEKSYFTKKLF